MFVILDIILQPVTNVILATIFLQVVHQLYAMLVIYQCLTAYNVLQAQLAINARLATLQEHAIAVY